MSNTTNAETIQTERLVDHYISMFRLPDGRWIGKPLCHRSQIEAQKEIEELTELCEKQGQPNQMTMIAVVKLPVKE